jgi:hypothetical protein
MLDHGLELGVLAEEMLADVGPVAGGVVLILAVDALLHALLQKPAGIAGNERVPVGSPDDLDDVPARAAEHGLQLLDDLAVAAHRAVQALEVAVHDEDEVVELLARRQADGAEGFGLVGLAVADEGPYLAALGRQEPAIIEVAHEARLIDRHDGRKPHRHRGALPEVRHEPGAGIGRQPGPERLLAKAPEIIFLDTSLDEGTGVDPRRRVALDEHEIAPVRLARGMEKVIESDVVKRRAGGEARDVSAEPGVLAVGLDHHGHRVPADDGADAPLDGRVPRRALFLGNGDGVEIGGVRGIRQVGPAAPRLVDESLDEEVGALGALALDHGFERLHPLSGFFWVLVGPLCHLDSPRRYQGLDILAPPLVPRHYR